MIYSKKANFPFPLLMNNSDDYINPEFEIDASLSDNTDSFILNVTYQISSSYIENLLTKKKARLILIIKSKDNQFYILNETKNDIKNVSIGIPKSRLSLNSRTVLQLMIQAVNNLNFLCNNDLNSFYNEFKQCIVIPKGSALGFSNLLIFDGTQKKYYELFEKKVDKNIKSDIEIRLSDETIIITYRKESMQFLDSPKSRNLNNPYIYIGLQKALFRFLINNTHNPEEGIRLEDIGELGNALDQKLYNLMQAKHISEISLEKIEHIIYLISDNILTKYTETVRGLYNGN